MICSVCIWLFAVFTHIGYGLSSFLESTCTYYKDASKDYSYIHDFLSRDISFNDVHHNIQTQAYNALRVMWENVCFVPMMEGLSYSSVNKKALHKARAVLLGLEKHDNYRDDSGLQLAIALSYYLDNPILQFNAVKYHIQKWHELGSEIPKNLVKTTDYIGSVKTIMKLCIVTKTCKNDF